MFARALQGETARCGRSFSTCAIKAADFTHVIVGGGVVGLAIACKLQERDGVSTLLIERHGGVGQETSSRNSEVIHAGIYYGPNSLKTKLCIRGRHMLYDLAKKYSIPQRNCGKWVVAQDEQQMEELTKVHSFAQSVGVTTRFVPLDEGKKRQPDVRAEAGILESETTGIVDSHALMTYLHGAFADAGGDCAFHTTVAQVVPLSSGSSGWEIHTTSTPRAPFSSTNTDTPSPSAAPTTITAETFINAAGLAAIPLSNSILPPSRHRTPHYAKGTYYSYSASHPAPSTLVYPAPRPGHGGLGTHLTFDLAGRIRFGPDVTWVSSPADLAPNAAKLPEALAEIETYLPGLRREAVGLDYCGIRPKLGRMGAVASTGKAFQDFWIRREEGFEGWVNLLGIESPGLTSALAIAEEVEGLLYR